MLLVKKETAGMTYPIYPESIPLSVKVYFSLKRPKTSKLFYPHADLDNFFKSLGDGLNGVLWADDRQIVNMHACKRFSEEDSIEIHVDSVWGEIAVGKL